MKSIKVMVEDETLAKAQTAATNLQTSIETLILKYVQDLATAPLSRETARRRILQLSHDAKGEVGPRTWSREDLYAR